MALCRACALIAIASAYLSADPEDAGFPAVTIYSSLEVGADAQSYSVVQQADGKLLVGGAALLTFDGERWKHDAIPGTYALRHLNFGPDGRLWVAAVGDFGWFARTADENWSFHSLAARRPVANAPLGQVWRAFPDAQGATFVTDDRILRWDGAAVTERPMPTPHRLLGSEVNGAPYVHHFPTGVHALDGLTSRVVIPAEKLAEAGVAWMDARPADWLLATFNHGLFLLRNDSLVPFAPEVSDILRRDTFICGARLPEGRYALGTHHGGIVVMRTDGTLEQTLTEKDGLPTRSIHSLFVDRDGQLWATSRSNIFRIDLNSATVIFDQRAGLPQQTYYGIEKSGEAVFVSSDPGVLQLPRGRQQHAVSVLNDYAHHLLADAGGLWVSGLRFVKRLRDGVAETVYEAEKDVFVMSTSRLVAGRVYFGEATKITASDAGGKPRTVVNQMPDFARSIVEDDTGDIWMATVARGVFVARLQAETSVDAVSADEKFGLPKIEGRSFVRGGPRGAILVFAANGGWIKPAGATEFHAIKGFPPRAVTAVSEFGANGIGWIVHAESASRGACAAQISIEGGNARWQPHSIPGLAVIGSPRSIMVEPSDGSAVNLWIGGTKSVLRHVVRGGPSAPPPRPPLLRSLFRSVEADTPQPINAALPYSTREVEFEFALPEFVRRTSLRLESRIDGLDREWLPAAADSRRVLTALRDGNYIFRVRAVAETGVPSPETVFRFQVLPPWWRTRSALATESTAALFLLWGLYTWRVRSLHRRNVELEAKVRLRTTELEAASAAKTQFVANMSHDIRNPLNGIVGLVLALEDTKLDRRQREMIATLRECSTYLSSLVDDVLDFASIEAGKVELRPGPFVPQELLRSIVNTLKADANAHGALLLVEADPHLPPNVLGDAGRIQQILVNFVSNALKYAGGTIRLSVTSPADSIDEIEFAVTDEGPGISEADQRTLFTKFTRLKRSDGHDIRGAGLGLAACRLLADLMGGSVGVESRVGEGARFHLRLPLTITTAPVPRVAATLPNSTVLLVEDTDYNAWAAEAVLARLGLTCERARTGAAALELFGARRFNVVLLDRNLPDMDGTEVARRMREMETDGRHALLLAVTAYCTADDRALCLQAGMDAFVGKPLTPEKLRRVLLDAARQTLSGAAMPAPASAPPATPTPRELDMSLLKYLSDGTPEGFEAQVQRFLTALGETEIQVCEAQYAHDHPRLAAAAHRLLGQARMVRGTGLVEASDALERAATTKASDRYDELLLRVRGEVKALTAAMHRHRRAARSA